MQIEQGNLIPSTLKAVGEGITGAHFAIVHIGGISHRCVVKRAADREIAAECLCALLGDALGLPTLVPVIVTDPRDGSLWFGTREIGYPSLSARLSIGNSANVFQQQALANILSAWVKIGEVISFDELIANGDRNPGNVLWNGMQFTIIDHERALGNQPKYLNKLAAFATERFQPQRVASIQQASTAAALLHQSLLGINTQIWQSITNEFAGAPTQIANHCAAFIALVQANVAPLSNNTVNALTPLLANLR